MLQRHWETLEYPKILERLARYTDFSAGAELARALTPAPDLREARERLALTREARTLMQSRAVLDLGGVTDLRPLLDRARHGYILQAAELLQVRDTLEATERIQRYLLRLQTQFPGLADIAGRLCPQPGLVETILRVLDERGEVRDNASPELARIRHEIHVTQDRLQERLRRYISSSEVAPYLQETLITRREGRFVIPVKADFKGQIPGVVHDRSSSGMTIFVEPLHIVEMNNALREARIAEEEEINRLLAALTMQVAAVSEPLEATIAALAELDLTFAKARYAEDTFCSEPELLPVPAEPPAPVGDNYHPGTVVRLQGARHPLLDPQYVVPVDVVLDEETHIAIITGPNTGGKTVTLKTVGLLALMAQSGLHIPVDAGSALSFFESIYADIGDEQSIEQSLSTFSAHLSNILSFLDQVDHHSLVLLDELGAGTDPAEGAALARALLEHCRTRRVTGLVATHYPELKLYAHATPGVTNASMEFNAETLAPTFHFSIGLPGRSNAFAIARRLGMPETIVREAQALLSGESLRVEDMLTDLHQLRLQTVQARDQARQERHDAEIAAFKLRERLAGIEKERQAILQRAETTARQELEALRDELRRLRQRLATLPVTTAPAAELRAAVEEVTADLAAAEELITQPEPLGAAELQLPEPPSGPPRVGDTVRLRTLGVHGTVAALEGSEAVIQAGALRTRAALDDLELLQRGRPRTETAEPVWVPTRGPSPGLQLDLRGLTGEEALTRLEHYLDDAARAGLPWVRIVHGKGTGTLRREVRRFLHDHPLVTGYEAAADKEGGEGATVVHLIPAG